eukprot:354212-Chlamydomonas_euryale.AAC.21
MRQGDAYGGAARRHLWQATDVRAHAQCCGAQRLRAGGWRGRARPSICMHNSACPLPHGGGVTLNVRRVPPLGVQAIPESTRHPCKRMAFGPRMGPWKAFGPRMGPWKALGMRMGP